MFFNYVFSNMLKITIRSHYWEIVRVLHYPKTLGELQITLDLRSCTSRLSDHYLPEKWQLTEFHNETIIKQLCIQFIMNCHSPYRESQLCKQTVGLSGCLVLLRQFSLWECKVFIIKYSVRFISYNLLGAFVNFLIESKW